MQVINLTEKTITVVDAKGLPLKVFPSLGRAQATSHLVKRADIMGIPIYVRVYGQVKGLPQPDENGEKLYIVDEEVAEAVKDSRFDILVAGDAISTDTGKFYRSLIEV